MPKRTIDDADAPAELKRLHASLESMADDLLCPITLQLPMHPVIAEDGRTYERSAIEAHIRIKASDLKSPITNEAMGPKLVANYQACGTIETLVRTGVIDGDHAKGWLQRLQEEDEVKTARAKAEDGDAEAMHLLGSWCQSGEKGCKKNDVAAYFWFARGAAQGNVPCLAERAHCLIVGAGVNKNAPYGLALTFQAAERGSDVAAFRLGVWFYFGCYGLPKDHAESLAWYKQVAAARVKHLDPEMHGQAATRVRELSNSACTAVDLTQ